MTSSSKTLNFRHASVHGNVHVTYSFVQLPFQPFDLQTLVLCKILCNFHGWDNAIQHWADAIGPRGRLPYTLLIYPVSLRFTHISLRVAKAVDDQNLIQDPEIFLCLSVASVPQTGNFAATRRISADPLGCLLRTRAIASLRAKL